jgi:Do/DeqQ family serine protease
MRISLSSLGRRFWRPAGIVAIGAAALVAAGGGVSRISARSPLASPSPLPAATAPAATTSYADAVAHAAPAVVTVRIERKAEVRPSMFDNDPFFQRFFGGQDGQGGRRPSMQAPIEHGVGSGVIVSEDGNILTNNHVVGGADHVTVALSDGREFTAKVLGTDEPTDLAVVHIDAKDLPTLPLGDSDRVRVGDVVLAIGNPLDVGQTVTMGIISAKGRTTDMSGGSYEDFLQTDAPINRGNSGGALITATGELIGINSQILSDGMQSGNIGIGFAIPSNMARNVANQLVTTGRVRRAIIGVTIQPLTSDLAKSLGLSSVHGALVNSVEADGPAAAAGLKQGDVIVKVNGTAIDDSNQLRNRISSQAPGTTVNLDVIRNGAERQFPVKLAEMPNDDRAASNTPASGGDFGLQLAPLTPSLAQQYGLPRSASGGVVVTDVNEAGAAARAGLREGDVIREINGAAVRTPNDVREALAAKSDKPTLAYVQRGDHSFYMALAR